MEFINILSFLFASGLGFGLSCWIYGTMLDKSNNIGDSKGDSSEYGVMVQYTMKRDDLNSSERSVFSSTYAKRIDNNIGPNGNELVRRLSEEEIKDFKQAQKQAQAQEQNNSGYMPPVTPVVRPKTMEDEIREWERSMLEDGDESPEFKSAGSGSNANPHSPFKPLGS